MFVKDERLLDLACGSAWGSSVPAPRVSSAPRVDGSGAIGCASGEPTMRDPNTKFENKATDLNQLDLNPNKGLGDHGGNLNNGKQIRLENPFDTTFEKFEDSLGSGNKEPEFDS